MSSQHEGHTTLSPSAAVLLGFAAVAGTTLTGIVLAQSVFPLKVYEGATALLAAVLALTGTGVIVCTAADRVMRRMDQLAATVSAQRVAYLPPAPKTPGVRHLAAVGETPGVGLDPETIAAARALARRIVDGPTEARRDAE